MKNILTLSVLCLLLPIFGCGSAETSPAKIAPAKTPSAKMDASPTGLATPDRATPDRTTPEGAILALEEAYRNQDIEAAVLCKDFKLEAQLMLAKVQPKLKDDPEIVAETTKVLELGFRSEKKGGFPDFDGVKSTFSEPKPYAGRDDVVELMETCRLPNGREIQNKMFVAKTADGWKVISVME